MQRSWGHALHFAFELNQKARPQMLLHIAQAGLAHGEGGLSTSDVS